MVGCGRNSNSFQAFIDVLDNYKNEDPIKKEGTRVVTTFLQLYVYGNFSRRAILLNFEPIHDSAAALVKNEEDPIKSGHNTIH